MAYVNFEYYKENYKGKAIANEQDFDFYAEIGSQYIKNATLDKANESIDSVKRCNCAIADVLSYYGFGGQEQTKVSESIGGYSVNYATKDISNMDIKINNLIKLYLANTGLLYRGL